MTLRTANELGGVNIDKLDSHHSCSFGSYNDYRHMEFVDLRALNDDVVLPDTGFDLP